MTILVTGGAGFIGANFVGEWLAGRSEAVVNLDKLTYAGSPERLTGLAGNLHTFVEGDIGDHRLVRDLLAEHRPRAILNFAAESHVDRSISGPAAFIDTNIVGTFNLLEAARAHWGMLAGAERHGFRFLHISTDEVFGALGPDEAALTEDAPFRPNSPYSAAKAASDHLVRAYFHTYGLPVLTTHSTNNYGPLQYPEKLIPVVIDAAGHGRPIPLYANGENVRDWIHVSDHCSAISAVLDRGRPGETYNISAENEVRNIDLIEMICLILDEFDPRGTVPHRQLIASVADRPGHDFRYALDAGKLRRELGWTPLVAFGTGLRETVRWYLDNPAWVAAMLDRAGPPNRR